MIIAKWLIGLFFAIIILLAMSGFIVDFMRAMKWIA